MKDEIKVTPQEIVTRIKAIQRITMHEVEVADLAARLPFELAKPYIGNTTQAKFELEASQLQPPLATCKAYLDFAWHKANDSRELSALRSIRRISAWLFLAGFGDLVAEHFAITEDYGKQQLVITSLICGFSWGSVDNHEWYLSADPLKPLPVGRMMLLIQNAYRIVETSLAKRSA